MSEHRSETIGHREGDVVDAGGRVVAEGRTARHAMDGGTARGGHIFLFLKPGGETAEHLRFIFTLYSSAHQKLFAVDDIYTI